MIAGDEEEEVLWVVAAAASFQRTSCGLRRAYCSSATSDFSADHSSALPGVMTSPVKKSEKKSGQEDFFIVESLHQSLQFSTTTHHLKLWDDLRSNTK